MLGFTGDARYGDGLERALLNTTLGAIDPDDNGGHFYYSDYHDRAHKGYYHNKWPCCAGTLVQSVADYPLGIYFGEGQGIAVNLYAPSEVRWNAGAVPVRLRQMTAYPAYETIAIEIDLPAPVRFPLSVRIPGWLETPARIAINRKRADVEAVRGTFARIDRTWKRGNTVSLMLPFSLRPVAIDRHHADLVAMMYGPVMLCAIDAPENPTAKATAHAAMKPVLGRPLHIDCAAEGGTVRMKPFCQITNETYSTYCTRLA